MILASCCSGALILVVCFVGWVVQYSRKGEFGLPRSSVLLCLSLTSPPSFSSSSASEFRAFWTSEDAIHDDNYSSNTLEMKPSFTSSSSSLHSRTPSSSLVVHTLSTVPTLLIHAEPQPKHHPPPSSPSKTIRHTSRAPSITSSLSVDHQGNGSTMKKRSPLGSSLPTQSRLSSQSVTVTIASELGAEASRAGLWDARSFGSAQISSEASHQPLEDVVRGIVPSRQWGVEGYGHQGLASPSFSMDVRSEKAPVMMGVGGEGSQSSLSEAGRGWVFANAALSSPAPSPAPGVAPDPNWGGGRRDSKEYSELSYCKLLTFLIVSVGNDASDPSRFVLLSCSITSSR